MKLDYLKAITEEQTALVAKMKALEDFIDTPECRTLNVEEQNDLKMQYQAMLMYAFILQKRIDRANLMAEVAAEKKKRESKAKKPAAKKTTTKKKQ